jgi:hypothetical protein
MKNKHFLIISLIALGALQTWAQSKLSFPTILQSLNGDKKHLVADVPKLQELFSVSSLSAAGEIVKGIEYSEIAEQERSTVPAASLQTLLKKRQITFVIVPGLLAEFIKTPRPLKTCFRVRPLTKKLGRPLPRNRRSPILDWTLKNTNMKNGP